MAATTTDQPTARYLRVVGIRASGAAGKHLDKRQRRRRTRSASRRAGIVEHSW